MQITEIRVKLLNEGADHLKAYCSVTFDDQFVVRDVKIIEGGKGMFVAMPSRKLTDRCNKCRGKNHLRARYCNECGNRLSDHRVSLDDGGRERLHADVAHPITVECRQILEASVLDAYREELDQSGRVGTSSAGTGDDHPDVAGSC